MNCSNRLENRSLDLVERFCRGVLAGRLSAAKRWPSPSRRMNVDVEATDSRLVRRRLFSDELNGLGSVGNGKA